MRGERMNKKVIICEDSFDGILSGVYDAWVHMNENKGDNIILSCAENYNMELFMEYIYVEKNMENAIKVAKSIRKKISSLAYKNVYTTAISCNECKADLIFRFLKYGYKIGRSVTECLAIPEVSDMMKIVVRVGKEYDHFRGFLRFYDRGDGWLQADIEPENDIIELLGQHFGDRLPNENFIIKDIKRNKTAIHKKNMDYCIFNDITLENVEDRIAVKGSEEYYQNMWKVFFETIAIESRTNEKLQKTNVPLRYRKYMTEFDKINS